MPKARSLSTVQCELCGKFVSRKADLARHQRTHATNKEELMYACPYANCAYKTLQRTNLRTHLNVHTGEKPNKCPIDGCQFETSDPGSLTRHRRSRHGHQTSSASRLPRKNTREERKPVPYPSTTTFLNLSVISQHQSPRAEPPQVLDLSPPLCPAKVTDSVRGDIKSTTPAYRTRVTDMFAQEVASLSPSVPFSSGIWTTPNPAHPVSEVAPYEINADSELDKFLAQLDAPQPPDFDLSLSSLSPQSYENSAVNSPLLDHTSTVLDNIFTTGYSNSTTPTSYKELVASLSPLPECKIEYIADSAAYDSITFSMGATTFDPSALQSYSYPTSDVGIYPDNGSSYTPCGTLATGAQGYYVY